MNPLTSLRHQSSFHSTGAAFTKFEPISAMNLKEIVMLNTLCSRCSLSTFSEVLLRNGICNIAFLICLLKCLLFLSDNINVHSLIQTWQTYSILKEKTYFAVEALIIDHQECEGCLPLLLTVTPPSPLLSTSPFNFIREQILLPVQHAQSLNDRMLSGYSFIPILSSSVCTGYLLNCWRGWKVKIQRVVLLWLLWLYQGFLTWRRKWVVINIIWEERHPQHLKIGFFQYFQFVKPVLCVRDDD